MAEGSNVQTVSEKAEKLRELFSSKHSGDIDGGHYDDRDIERYQTDDEYVASFIRSFETMQDACDHLHESLKFRLEYGINDLTQDSFPIEIWESGAAYYHNHDKDGHRILYLQVKLHKKDPELLPIEKKCFAYLLETHIKQHPGESIVVLFDLAGAGLAHLDMEFIKFIINCFKLYYPKLLEYMLMYEMPWLFNAAWKVIKQMLHSESVKRIKFVTKADIQEYINKDQLWEHMGGTDKYIYSYDPGWLDTGNEGGGEPDPESTAKKRVTFAEDDGRMFKSFSFDSISDSASPKSNANSNSNGVNSNSNGYVRELRSVLNSNRQRINREDNTYMGRLLTICPAEELEFFIEDGMKEACDTITLKNPLPYSIAFKVKTTSPEKYRVRPSSGLIKPGTEAEVTIHLQQGYQNTVYKDKFLIMAMEVANESNRTFSELWKTVQKDSIMEHRLRCVVSTSKNAVLTPKIKTGIILPVLSDLSKKVDGLVECNRHLQQRVKLLFVTQVIIVLLMLALVTYTVLTYSWEQASRQASKQAEDLLSQQCLKQSCYG